MRAVVLVSGGLDSTTALFLARERYGAENVRAASCEYGQRHRREVLAARRIVAAAGVILDVIDIGFVGLFTGAKSSQVGDRLDVPLGHYADPNMRVTIVPNRNMVLLSLAGARAVSVGAGEVWYGAHAGDHPIYPDCRPAFVEKMAAAFAVADVDPLELVAPFLLMTKADIVRRGVDLGVPFGETYSCYTGRAHHCGRCGTCVERREAFTIAHVPDPTTYDLEAVL